MASAQVQPPISLPPTSISLLIVPNTLPPGGSGVAIVQLVDVNGNPAPARQDIKVSLFSSNPNIMNVSQRTVIVPFGKSHAEVQVKAYIPGSAELTAIANGFFSSSVQLTVSAFNNFALQLTPMNNFVFPGDTLYLRVGLLASGIPFKTPTGVNVQVYIATSLQNTVVQNVLIQPGTTNAYTSIQIPTNVDLKHTPFVSITAAASGFISATTEVSLSPRGSNPQLVLVEPPSPLPTNSTEFLAVSLKNNTFFPSSESVTLYLFSSNSSVVKPLVNQITLNGTESTAIFPVHTNATGVAQITAIGPGLISFPIMASVIKPFKPSLILSIPSKIRVGETYSFAVGFYAGNEPVPSSGPLPAYGHLPIYLSSSIHNITVPSVVETSVFGYGVARLTVSGTGKTNITAVRDNAMPSFAIVTSVYVPIIAPTTYNVVIVSHTGVISGVPVSFTYNKEIITIITDSSGTASFSSYNDTATTISVPPVVLINNITYFFTGWSNGAKTKNISLLSPAPLSIKAQYFKSIVPTTYTLQALSDGQTPIAGLKFNVSSKALKVNLELATDSQGKARFTLPNTTLFTVSLPLSYQLSGQIKYSFISLANSTKNVVNISSSSPITIVANYGTYYYLEVTSPIGTTTGTGWYRKGTTATYSIDQTSVGGPLVFQRFAGWTGNNGFFSDQPTGSIVITSPQLLTAQWVTDNTLLFAVIGAVLAVVAVVGVFIFRLKHKQKETPNTESTES